MTLNLERSDPLDCFSELAEIHQQRATFMTYGGESHQLTLEQLEARALELREVFSRHAMTPPEVQLTARQERALGVELFLLDLAKSEITNPPPPPSRGPSLCRDIHGVNTGINHKGILTPPPPSC